MYLQIAVCSMFIVLFSAILVRADHLGPEKLVAEKYVVTLTLTPQDDAMRLRVFFKDTRTGAFIKEPIQYTLTLTDGETQEHILHDESFYTETGIGESLHTFPHGGLYELSLAFSFGDENVTYSPDHWSLWVPGEQGNRSYYFGMSELSGFFLAGVLLTIVGINLWQRRKT